MLAYAGKVRSVATPGQEPRSAGEENASVVSKQSTSYAKVASSMRVHPPVHGQGRARTFPKPNVYHHVCGTCKAIPLELFLVASKLMSNRCRGYHAPGEPCKGQHLATCDNCSQVLGDRYHHCYECNRGQYDICEACLQKGATCLDKTHKLNEFVLEDGIYRDVVPDNIFQLFRDHTRVGRKSEVAIKASAPETGSVADFLDLISEPYFLHPNLESLHASAELGCHSCSVIATWLPRSSSLLKPNSAIYFYPFIVTPSEQWMTMTKLLQEMLEDPDLDAVNDVELPHLIIGCGSDTNNLSLLGPPIFELTGPKGRFFSRDSASTVDRLPRQISPIVDDLDHLSVIAEWIQSCAEDHKQCCEHLDKSFVPSRLVDVGVTGENQSIKIVEGSSVSQHKRSYVALSYCWGRIDGIPSWTTTKARLAAFQFDVPKTVLPRTILDAIQVARAIGCRYLWVDSMCIVQDDLEDWLREASTMAAVYMNSLCTLVAGTDSAHKGLFLPRNQLEVSAAKLTLNSVSGLAEPHEITLFPDLAKVDAHTGPTSARAWCMQEQLLSRRKVYFTEGQFFWECGQSTQDETGTQWPGDSEPRAVPYDPSAIRADIVYDAAMVTGEWQTLVQTYTSRALTVEKDIFPAMGGMASQLQKKYDCDYLAGIWEDSVAEELIWHRFGDSLDRPETYQAPSWSWFSIKGPVLFARGMSGQVSEVELISHQIETVDGNPYSETVGGKLVLRAPLIPSTVVPAKLVDEADPERYNEDDELLTNIYQDQEQNRRVHDKQPNFLAMGDSGGDEVEGDDGDDDDNESATSDTSSAQTGPPPGWQWRSAPWEAQEPNLLYPPGKIRSMMGALTTRLSSDSPSQRYATIFFDHPDDKHVTDVTVALIATTERPGDLRDRNGIAMVRVRVDDDGRDVFRRVGFVGFWDRILGREGCGEESRVFVLE